jgi:D-tagatose-1,6-bisphosphate aldolase subunit GatZ/KbaZ
VPGGVVADGGGVAVTRPEALEETVDLCRDSFAKRGLEDAWTRVRAVVAQPGVEFGDESVHGYDRTAAAPLCAAARGLPGIVLEGHSTDFQLEASLRGLVEDGIAVLKVGPGLTFALRECLFALECIERELLEGRKGYRLSGLSAALEEAMLAQPVHWQSYYRGGDPARQRTARRYSFSDRSRYYWNVPAVRAACDLLMTNTASVTIPLTLLSQFLPVHYAAVREGRLDPSPRDLVRESVCMILQKYSRAARKDY